MKKHNIPALLVLVFIMAACARPPTEEMERAHDAVIRAESDADAVNFAGNALIRARDALTRMQNEADAKRYEAARNFAAEAISNAERAIAEGRAGAARARENAENQITNLAGILTDTANALDAARQLDNIDLDFNALSRDMDQAHVTYDAARQSLEANDHRDAIARAQNARSLTADITAQINETVQAATRTK
jgi:hypothetical protein